MGNPTVATSSSVERWRPVLGFEGRYEVSDLGRVRSLLRDAPLILRPGKHRGGYHVVVLRRDSQPHSRTVHRLVLEAFVGPRPEGMECRHLDGDPTNNVLTNLRWGSREENVQDVLRHGNHYPGNRDRCNHGHEFTKENTLPRMEKGVLTGRRCKTCLDSGNRRRYLENRAARMEYQKAYYRAKRKRTESANRKE